MRWNWGGANFKTAEEAEEMKKDHSPFTCDSSGDRKQGGNGFRKDRPGFLLAIGLMFVAAALLAVAAGNRTADVAWGGLADSAAPEEFILPSSGFIVVDMSNVYPESVRQSSGSRGFLSAVIPGMGLSGESGQEKKALSWLPREDFADDRFAGNGSPSVFSGGSVHPARIVPSNGLPGLMWTEAPRVFRKALSPMRENQGFPVFVSECRRTFP